MTKQEKRTILFLCTLIVIMISIPIIYDIIYLRGTDYEGFSALRKYEDTLLTHYRNIYIPIHSEEYHKNNPSAIAKSLEIVVNVDSSLKISDSSTFLLFDNYRIIYDGIFKNIGTYDDFNIYYAKAIYYYKSSFCEPERLGLYWFDKKRKVCYGWYTYNSIAIYDSKKITFKLDQYSTAVAKTDGDWFYR